MMPLLTYSCFSIFSANGGKLGDCENQTRLVSANYKQVFEEAGLPEVPEALNQNPVLRYTQDLTWLNSLSPEELAALVHRSGRETALAANSAYWGAEMAWDNEQWVAVFFEKFKLEIIVRFFSLETATLSDNIHKLVSRKWPSDLKDPNDPFPYNAGAHFYYWFSKPDARGSLMKSRMASYRSDSDVSDEIKAKITAALTPMSSKSSNYHGVYLRHGVKHLAKAGKDLKGGYFVLQADAAYGADLLRKELKPASRTMQGVTIGINFATNDDYANARATEIESRNLNESDDGIGSIETMIAKLKERVKKTCEKKTVRLLLVIWIYNDSFG
jgi:hypothetical protein